MDGLDKLSHALYGRPAKTEDYEGGGNMRMLHDATNVIVALRSELEAARKQQRAQPEKVRSVRSRESR